MKIDWNKARAMAATVTAKAAPATRVLERTITLAAQFKNGITPMGAVGLAATGLNAASEWLREGGPCAAPSSYFPMWAGRAAVVRASLAAGAEVVKEMVDGGETKTWLKIGGHPFFVDDHGNVSTEVNDEFRAWMRQAVDRELPAAVTVVRGKSNPIADPLSLAPYETPAGRYIAESTTPLLSEGPRCILLTGKPGVGKTTIAQEVARRAAVGRTVLLSPGLFDDLRDLRDLRAVKTVVPGVIIVDDIDKIAIGLDDLEALRSNANLVILTANNGDNDAVLDGAMIRPGRIDEVFPIAGEPRKERPAPFDQLDEETWQRVNSWPIASLNELGKRIRHRGVDADALRIDEIEERMGRRTRSREVLQ